MSEEIKLLWIDLETTGLNPEKSSILEIAAVVTDVRLHSRGLGNWEPRSEFFSSTVRVEFEQLAARRMSKEVVEMHTKSGLLTDCLLAEFPVEAVQLNLLSWLLNSNRQRPHELAQSILNNDKAYMLAGNSVHFDRSFIRLHMPVLDSLLSHRHFDVRVLQTARAWFDPVFEWGGEGLPKHRALDDIKYSLNEARKVRDVIRSSGVGDPHFPIEPRPWCPDLGIRDTKVAALDPRKAAQATYTFKKES